MAPLNGPLSQLLRSGWDHGIEGRMVSVRGFLSAIIAVGTTTGAAHAQPKPTVPPLVGAAEVTKLTAPAGFVDDVAASDGERFAYVVADGSGKAELHVLQLASKQEQTIDISAVAAHPIAIQLVGQRALIVGVGEDGVESGAMIELVEKSKAKPAGSVVYKVAPAKHVTVITRDGKPRIAVHRAATRGSGTVHDVELLALDNGQRIATAKPFELEGDAVHKKLDLRVNHWGDGWTRAYGIKGGEWDPKENQRSPDVEATYDLVAGKLVDTKKIDDLFEQRKRYQALADAGGTVDFVRIANNAMQLWRGGKLRAVELDQPLSNYESKSIQTVLNADGSAWLGIKMDPVNPDAVARKKADLEYFDVFRIAADGKAVRKARVLAAGVRHRFGMVGDKMFWLLERSQGFERGGKSLTIYQFQ